MSARIITKNNISIVGLYKNASQSIKQITKENEGWTLCEKFNKCIDLYDSNNKIYIPVRDEWDRHISGILEHLVNELQEIHGNEPSIKDINEAIDKLRDDRWEINSFKGHMDHFTNIIGTSFLTDIFGNNDWDGAHIYYFDMKYFSSHLPDYLNLDIKIPFRHTVEDSNLKKVIRKILKDEFDDTHKVSKSNSVYTMELMNCRNFIWKEIKNSKHWINFQTK